MVYKEVLCVFYGIRKHLGMNSALGENSYFCMSPEALVRVGCHVREGAVMVRVGTVIVRVGLSW